MGHSVSRGYKYGDLVLQVGLGTVTSIVRDDWERSIKEAKVRIGL
jgi:hypothetical protein